MKRRLRSCTAGLAALLLAACGSDAPPPGAAAPATPAAPETALQPLPLTRPEPGRGGARTGQWLRAEAERKGWPIAWDFREDFAPGQRALPQLAVISLGRNINYSHRYDATFERELDQREQRLRQALGERAELVAVMDWQLQHDWFFYTEAGVSEAEIRAALLGMPGRDVRITLEPDTDATFYRTLVERVHSQP